MDKAQHPGQARAPIPAGRPMESGLVAPPVDRRAAPRAAKRLDEVKDTAADQLIFNPIIGPDQLECLAAIHRIGLGRRNRFSLLAAG